MNNPKAELLLKYLKQAPEGLAVEIGCIREAREVIEDGHSTPYLAKECAETGRTFLSFDIEEKAVNIANGVLATWGLPSLVEQKDGKTAIQEITEPIAFLFLDSHRHPQFTLDQYREAELLPGAVLIVDDCQPIDGYKFGKAEFVKMLFDHHGIQYEIFETANNGQYQWRSLCAILENGKTRGAIK